MAMIRSQWGHHFMARDISCLRLILFDQLFKNDEVERRKQLSLYINRCPVHFFFLFPNSQRRTIPHVVHKI